MFGATKCAKDSPNKTPHLEISCTESYCYFSIPLVGLVSLESLCIESSSRCQEIYDAQENYIGTCTRASKANRGAPKKCEYGELGVDIEWIPTELTLDEPVLVSGRLSIKVRFLTTLLRRI